MALLEIENSSKVRVALWKIEESESFFLQKVTNEIPSFSYTERRLQFLASRYLLNELHIDPLLVTKDEFGRPIHPHGDIHLSISHCKQYAAVAVSSKFRTGIDVEPIREKVRNIAHKFLHPHEIELSDTVKLMIHWSAKESLYKLYGERGLDFKEHLRVQDFIVAESGALYCSITTSTFNLPGLQVQYQLINHHVLCWVVA